MRVSQDEAAAFVEAHEKAVYTFCLRMLGEPECAEALAQEVLLQAYLEQPGHNVQEVLQLAYRLCQDALQERPYPTLTNGYDMHALLGQLPLAERAAMILRHCLHLSGPESAQILGHSHDAIRQMVRQARYRMATYVIQQPAGDGSVSIE